MPAPLLSRSEIIARLTDLFRRRGYDGASLAEIAQVTGLGKSSLYHYFPGGKEEMATAVLAEMARTLEVEILSPLSESGPPARRLNRMIESLDRFYEGGRQACLLERLAASADRSAFSRPLRAVFTRWIEAVAGLLRDGGIPPGAARARAEDAVLRIEGALVLSGATGSQEPFVRTLSVLRRELLAR